MAFWRRFSAASMTLAAAAVFYLSAQASQHPPASPEPSLQRQAAVTHINADYQALIKPIFQAKCFDCHSHQSHYPFYYRLPVARGVIDKDIRQALKHMDLSQGFPFKNQAEPEKDLDTLHDTVSDDAMPPLLYKLAHWGSGLRDGEKAAILRWADEGKSALLKTKS
jgi:hypothetical protein